MEDGTTEIPDTAREIAKLYLDQIDLLTVTIYDLTVRLRDATQENVEMRRLCTVPGVGPVTAGAVMAFAPGLRTFVSIRRGPRDGLLCRIGPGF